MNKTYFFMYFNKIYFLAALLLLTFATYSFADQVYDKVIVSVGSQAITQRQLDKSVEVAWASQQKKGKIPPSFKREVLQSLINKNLLLNYATDRGLKVSIAQVTAKINEIRKARRLTMQQLISELKKEDLNLYAFQQQVRENILYEQAVQFFILAHANVSEAELRKQYEQPKKTTERHIRHIFFAVPSPDQEEAVREKAQKVYESISSISQFNKAVLTYSEDKATKNQQGDLGYHVKEDLLKALQAPVFAAKLKMILKPIRSQVGYHIVLVDGSKEIIFKTRTDFDLKKQALMQQASIQARQKRLDTLLRRLKSEYLIEYKE